MLLINSTKNLDSYELEDLYVCSYEHDSLTRVQTQLRRRLIADSPWMDLVGY